MRDFSEAIVAHRRLYHMIRMTGGAAAGSRTGREQLPLPRNVLQRVQPAILEPDAGS